jgi:hypothetical protein
LKLRNSAAAVIACAFVAGCSTTPSAPPPPPPTPAQLLAEASASDFTCTRANATVVDFQKLLGGAEPYADKCVRVKGLASFRVLVRDAATLPGQKAAAIPPSALGLYWKDETMRKLDTGPQFIEIIGRLRVCDARNKLEQAAGVSSPITPCRSATAAIFVSQSHVFPTAMD